MHLPRSRDVLLAFHFVFWISTDEAGPELPWVSSFYVLSVFTTESRSLRVEQSKCGLYGHAAQLRFFPPACLWSAPLIVLDL